MKRTGSMKKHLGVLVSPLYTNPYQRLLYRAMMEAHPGSIQIKYLQRLPLIGLAAFPLQFAVYRMQGYALLHIHWQRFELRPWFPFNQALSVWSNRFLLACVRWLGYRIVWTVHNIVPHEPQTTDDVAEARHLAEQAAAVIVHSGNTLEAMREADMRTDHATVIPHGHFIGVYGEAVARSEARARLQLPPTAFVILAFGRIRPYKGIERLVDFVRNSSDSSLRLVIAGVCQDESLLSTLRAAATLDERVILRVGKVDDRDVGFLFGACDVVCAPFRNVTTSGSVILAMSFGRPVVAPRIGALVDLPSEVGFLYAANDVNGLEEALGRARESTGREAIGAAARAYAESLPWRPIAEATWAVYEGVLSSSGARHSPGRRL
jgi:beta-1,4-mannosyltransferase